MRTDEDGDRLVVGTGGKVGRFAGAEEFSSGGARIFCVGTAGKEAI